MQEATFDLQTLTPLFLAGHNQAAVELRPPSFRGEMRYWLRALVGGLVGTDPAGLQTVIAVEKQVFGSTDVGSQVAIRLAGDLPEAHEFRRESRGRYEVSGKDYLLWTMPQSGKQEKNNFKSARKYIPERTLFQATISTRGVEKSVLDGGVAAFWLLTQLGGIGSRSRRCAGSLLATSSNTITFPFGISQNIQGLQQQLSKGIGCARDVYMSFLDDTQKSQIKKVTQANFDALAPDTARIWLLRDSKRPWQSADDAMRAIGSSLQDYRSSLKLHQRAIFGLPLKDVSGERRASPLLLRVSRVGQNQYVGVAVLFKTFYNVQRGAFNMADYQLIEQWVEEDFPDALEVKL